MLQRRILKKAKILIGKQQSLCSIRSSPLPFIKLQQQFIPISKISTRSLSIFGSVMPANKYRNSDVATKDVQRQVDDNDERSRSPGSPNLKSNSNNNDKVVYKDDCDEQDEEMLNALEESYNAARQEQSNKWLTYMKTCHIYLYRGGGEPNDLLAAFDLDGTIIKPKSNKRIPKNATDWQFFSVWTKVKLQQVVRENVARFVMFTNQNGVGLRLVALEEIQERVELVTKRLDIPCTVFVATEKDSFRKPNIGMFNLFKKSFNGNSEINYEKSFYCGDAVGYPSHSDADIKFAQTLGLPFLPPEKFVRGVKPKLVVE